MTIEPALTLALLASLFVGTHVGLATGRVRAALVARLGDGGFFALYTFVATVSFAAMIGYYAVHRFEGAPGLALGQVAAARWPLMALIVAGVMLTSAGLTVYPRLAVALCTDQAVTAPEFDRVEPVVSPHARSKVDYLAETPFAETLYLDTDTRVLGDLSEMFRLLERFEMALAQRAHVPASPARAVWRHAVPSSFPPRPRRRR